MSNSQFFQFAASLNSGSPEFPGFAAALRDDRSLVAYAAKQGYALSGEDAEAFIAETRRRTALVGDPTLSEDDLEHIQGGISWTGVGAAVFGGAATLVAAAFVAPAAIATGTVLAGVAAIGGAGFAGGGIGAMIGGAADLISDAVS